MIELPTEGKEKSHIYMYYTFVVEGMLFEGIFFLWVLLMLNRRIETVVHPDEGTKTIVSVINREICFHSPL